MSTNYPEPSVIVEQVCKAINANAKSIYTPHCLKVVPINPEDVREGKAKVRPHSDARAISAIILRKHFQVHVGFGEYKAPTLQQIKGYLGLSPNNGSGGGMSHRMITMCELMRKEPNYRKIYTGAVTSILSAGYQLCAVHDFQTNVPCQ